MLRVMFGEEKVLKTLLVRLVFTSFILTRPYGEG